MNEVQKPNDKLMEEIFNKTFGLVGYLFKNTKDLLLFILYMVLSLIFLFLIITSSQEIISSKLISFIITMYFKDKLLITTGLIGLGSALTLLIGYISSENEEKIIGREGKLLSGLTFWHRFLTSAGSLILIIVFTNTYNGGLNYQELLIFTILIVTTTLLWIHFTNHLNHVYNWNTLEKNEYRILMDIILGGFAFNVGFFFYIYSLQHVETLIFNILNLWVFFINVIFLASFKYPRTRKIVVKYSNDREEYAHLVRIENGFARIVTKESLSKQINLNEIKELNYDTEYIENFKKSNPDS